jgi:hypothetical protein
LLAAQQLGFSPTPPKNSLEYCWIKALSYFSSKKEVYLIMDSFEFQLTMFMKGAEELPKKN